MFDLLDLHSMTERFGTTSEGRAAIILDFPITEIRFLHETWCFRRATTLSDDAVKPTVMFEIIVLPHVCGVVIFLLKQILYNIS